MSHDFDATFEEKAANQEAQAALSNKLAGEFLAACRKADANGLCDFAPMVLDSPVYPVPFLPGVIVPSRLQTLGEIMQDSLDFGTGPTTTELMQLVLNVAHGTDLVNAPAQARALLGRMAESFGNQNT
jgi:hypothetical protein